MRRSLTVICLVGLLFLTVSSTKTSSGLVQHARMALGESWGYVWGTIGQVLTESILQQKIRQYPDLKPKEAEIRNKYLGKRTADCVGLIKSYLWWNGGNIAYDKSQDKTAEQMFKLAPKSGPISSLPNVPGLCLYLKGHIGVYIGDGWAIESKGFDYGVVQTRVQGRGWTNWMQCPFIRY
ncbi:hypothetical protein P9112_003848 [Eukaryota sp. TZLM1-RC]